MSPEEWRPVVEHEDSYEVSSLGRVRGIDRLDAAGHQWRGRILSPSVQPSGHLRVALWRDGKRSRIYVHRLVAEAFIGTIPIHREVCHSDGDPSNNRVENLRIDTHSSNMRDKLKHGTNHEANKTACPQGHAFDVENTYVYTRACGGETRYCRTCRRARERVRRNAAREREAAVRP